MRRLLVATLGGLLLVVITWHSTRSTAVSEDFPANLTGDVAKGAYLARASGCIACHTDLEQGGAPLAGGPPLVTPFGTFYAPNLTTDKHHGIGGWSIEQFAQAVRQGKSPQGERYYPAFPYTFYTRLSDQDIADLWAAFSTVPPVPMAAPQHQLDFPYNLRQGLIVWQSLFFTEDRFQPRPDKTASYNRGAYLVESVTHCAACHGSRNVFAALDSERPFSGGQSLLQGEGKVPAITAAALSGKGWTEQDLAYALQVGLKHDGDAFGGSMGEVVRYGTAFMRKQDLQAIAHYLMQQK
ncbi:c-type cytochrome [Pontibacter sp. JAM-7]|uniref:c-type cytochrome n=1 Tax=Pontibacter sp. JAM-7 TaxID=3366581 RepID=UPI003AF64014